MEGEYCEDTQLQVIDNVLVTKCLVIVSELHISVVHVWFLLTDARYSQTSCLVY